MAGSGYEKYICHQLQRPPYYSSLLSGIQYRNIIKSRLDLTTTTTLGRRGYSAQQVENGILNIIKIDSCQAARGRRSSQHEIDRRKLAERQRESEQRMIQACGEDQIYANH